MTFGKPGNQRLLTVNDAQAVYEKAVLDWIIADGVTPPTVMQDTARVEWTTGSPHVYIQNGIAYIGVNTVTDKLQVGIPRYSRYTDGTNAMQAKVRWMDFAIRTTQRT